MLSPLPSFYETPVQRPQELCPRGLRADPLSGQRDSTGLGTLGQKKQGSLCSSLLGFFFRSKQATLGVPRRAPRKPTPAMPGGHEDRSAYQVQCFRHPGPGQPCGEEACPSLSLQSIASSRSIRLRSPVPQPRGDGCQHLRGKPWACGWCALQLSVSSVYFY